MPKFSLTVWFLLISAPVVAFFLISGFTTTTGEPGGIYLAAGWLMIAGIELYQRWMKHLVAEARARGSRGQTSDDQVSKS